MPGRALDGIEEFLLSSPIYEANVRVLAAVAVDAENLTPPVHPISSSLPPHPAKPLLPFSFLVSPLPFIIPPPSPVPFLFNFCHAACVACPSVGGEGNIGALAALKQGRGCGGIVVVDNGMGVGCQGWARGGVVVVAVEVLTEVASSLFTPSLHW